MSAAKLVAPDNFTPQQLPDADVAARFRASLTTLFERDAGEALKNARFGVALSGGPDSVALLLLAAAAFPGQVEAATVDHRLRPEARAEALWCADICAALAIPHEILTVDSAIDGNIQSGARRARYALLQNWMAPRGLDWLLTAHHADDQAETLLMRLNRGAGVSGLAGVRGRNGNILRPLLGWRRAELQAIGNDAGLTPCDDPSNRDTSYDRVRMRQRLSAIDWIDSDAVSRSANHLADAEAALLWIGNRLAADHIVRDKGGDSRAILLTAPLESLPRELARRLLLRALTETDPAVQPRGDALDRLLGSMIANEQAMIGDLLVTPDAAAQLWRIRPAPPRAQPKDRG